MTREEYQRKVHELTMEWSLRYADRIEVDPELSQPHGGPGTDSDLNETGFLAHAPAEYDDILMEKLDALNRQYHATERG